MRMVDHAVERWPLARPFRIARGVKMVAEVVRVTIEEDGVAGRGEGVPYARYGESGATAVAQIGSVAGAIADGGDRATLGGLLPPGAARNAIDCALWDLDLKRGLAMLPAPTGGLTTALTVGIDTPAAMAAAARALPGDLIKVKVDQSDVAERLRAVRAARGDARLIVDPNESWSFALLRELQPLLAELCVTFVEQPLPAGEDAALAALDPLVPICADESCHVAGDLAALAGRYQLVNVKLDKAGGLTGALELESAARAAGFGILVGCMICTSLSIAPALTIAARADYVDLDGPWWLTEDRPGGVRVREGLLHPPAPGFWGAPV